MRPGDAAHAVGWITGRRDRALRFVCVLHEGKEQRLRAGIHRPLDHHHVVPRRAHDRLRRRSCDRLQDADHLRRVDRRVLHVDDQKVEAYRRQRFGGRRRSTHQPCADGRLARGDRALELIDRHFHEPISRKKSGTVWEERKINRKQVEKSLAESGRIIVAGVYT